MSRSPLNDPRPLAVEERLNAGDLDAAQRLLGELDPDVPAAAYLAVRLLYARGRLTPAQVEERLRELLSRSGALPEAIQFLRTLGYGDAGASSSSPPRERLDSNLEFRRISEGPAPPADAGDARTSAPAPEPLPSSRRPQYSWPESDYPPEPSAADQDRRSSPSALSSERPSRPSSVGRYSEATPIPDGRRTIRPAESDVRSSAIPSSRAPVYRASVAPLLEDAAPAELPPYESAREKLLKPSRAELVLQRARELAGRGSREDARRELEQLVRAPLLEPEIRAGCGRLLIALGAEDAGLQQAELAYAVDAHAADIRLAVAFGCIRAARRNGKAELLDRAASLLQGFRAHETDAPALVYALRACVQAALGDPTRVVTVAQRALSIDPRVVDALAAIAVAAARTGQIHEARQTLVRVAHLDRREADALGAELARWGVVADTTLPTPQPASTQAARVWDETELQLVEGRELDAMKQFELGCSQRLRSATGEDASGHVGALAGLAASWFTIAPVFRHFAPFDRSLWSLARIEAALSSIYGSDPRPWLSTDDTPARTLLAAYWCDTLRHCYDALFEGAPTRPETWTVSGAFGHVRAFELMTARLGSGVALAHERLPEIAPDDARNEAWWRRLPCSTPPPSPWDPAAWPDVTLMPSLGLALAQSVVSAYCERVSHGRLDCSLTSLGALDVYLALIAPVRATADPGAAWCRRVSVLVGAYLGETLKASFGGEWRGPGPGLDERSYTVALRDDVEAQPVAHAAARLGGRTGMSLVEYAQKLAKRLG
jgi:tetratricopeptide (TPR) repeat protein